MKITSSIIESLNDIGIEQIPENHSEMLESYGFDSLMLVMFISKIESKLNMKLDLSSLKLEYFRSIDSITEYLNKEVKS